VKKSQRVEAFVGILGSGEKAAEQGFDACYLGYFECFNEGLYYEAHDVLENLWLKEGPGAPDYRFHKGLIQLAGGFVHLKLQHAHPNHPKHGRRLDPARRLFLLAAGNLSLYGPWHRGMEVGAPVALAVKTAALIGEEVSSRNPWDPGKLPRLTLPVMNR
jgi:hypothetical protein